MADGDMQGGKNAVFAELMAIRELAPPAPGEVRITGNDPFFRAPFRIGGSAAAALAATGVAANDIWQLRSGRRQSVAIGVRAAAATLRTIDYTARRTEAGTFERVPVTETFAHMLTVTQPWPTRDGRWFLPHLNLPHLAARVLGVLGCENTPAAVAAAVAKWNADELEEAIAAAGACGGTIRTPEEWQAHPQGQLLARQPVIDVARTNDASPQPFHSGARPLSGVRVLDLTRILAGPVGTRALAEHGADVLMVAAAHLPQAQDHVRDTSHGKRSCFLDFRQPADASRFADLVREADVVFDGYRPGVLGQFGFAPDDLFKLRPGLVHISVSCFGSDGPFGGRAGWEQVAQAVTGVCHTNGLLTKAGQPKLVFAPMCDYITGYLAAYGAMLALARRAREGGGYRVAASLCKSAMLVQRQGLLDDFGQAPERLDAYEIDAQAVTADTCDGTLRTLGPALRMSETPCRWDRPTPKLGGDVPEWLPR
jgi:crotonobetainyl-CoA:carnitine CoA-transferase CaiB-like acyl-CoA transferase